MKKLATLIISALFLIPALSSAQGLHCTGYVTVSTNSSGYTYIYGTPNVRWNTVGTTYSEYIYVSAAGNSTGTVTIGAFNDDGTFGYCYVPSTSAYYETAKHLSRQNGDGTYIYAYKNSTSNECQYVYTQNHSCRLH